MLLSEIRIVYSVKFYQLVKPIYCRLPKLQTSVGWNYYFKPFDWYAAIDTIKFSPILLLLLLHITWRQRCTPLQ